MPPILPPDLARLLAIGSEAVVYEVDQSASIFSVRVGSVSGLEVLLIWTAEEEPLYPPRRGERVRIVPTQAVERDVALDGTVLREERQGLVVEIDRPPQPLERRRDVRVDTAVPLRFTVLSDEAAADLREEIAAGRSPGEAPDPLDEVLQRLDELERMMRRIAERLGVHAGARRSGVDLRGVRDVNVSASGLRFRTAAPVPIGARVELDVELRLSPPERVLALLEVTRCEQAGGEWVVAGRFDALRSDDRAAVVRYVVQVQRQMAARRGGR